MALMTIKNLPRVQIMERESTAVFGISLAFFLYVNHQSLRNQKVLGHPELKGPQCPVQVSGDVMTIC